MAVLSVKKFPEELMVLLKVRAARERSTLRSIVIGELRKVTGVPSATEALKQCKFVNTNPGLYATDTEENITGTVIAGPLEQALLQIRSILIDFNKSMIVARLREGRQRVKATKGRCEGCKPFGHYPGEALTLAYIRRLRSEGMQYHNIADRLRSEGYTARSGGQWRGPVVGKILRRDKVVVM